MFTSQFNTLSGVSYCEYKLCVMFSWVISLTVATCHCYWSRAQWQDSELCSQKGIYIQHQWNIYIYRATVFRGFQERVRETHVKHLFVESRTWYTHRPIQHRDPLSFWSGPGQSIQVDGHRGQKKHQGPQGSTNASQATLTEVSTTIQWGTLLQHGLKYCQDPSAMMCAQVWESEEHRRTDASLVNIVRTACQGSHWWTMTVQTQLLVKSVWPTCVTHSYATETYIYIYIYATDAEILIDSLWFY